jgi:NAD(P)-dependent dehydrogenase (short-subunit alcohol dehydrogenase family)
MLLDGKRTIIHGAGGALGGAIARTFAREGARVFLAGRREASLGVVAADIAGGPEGMDVVDALDEAAVDEYTDAVAARAGGVDVVLNAIDIQDVQGTPIVEMTPDDFASPILAGTRTHFLTSRAAARHMIPAGAGAIVTLSASPAGLPGTGMGGFGVACAAIEAFTRHLAGELGPHGIRVVCVRPDKVADAPPELDPEFKQTLVDKTLLKRLPSLAETAEVAAFVASDRASAMTATVANMTCGTLID